MVKSSKPELKIWGLRQQFSECVGNHQILMKGDEIGKFVLMVRRNPIHYH